MNSDYESYWRALQASHDIHPTNRYRYHLVLKFIKRYAPQGASVHDIGCGSGELLSRISCARPDLQLSGSDISSTAVNLANRKGLDCFVADFSQGTVDSTLFHSFDIVILSEVIEHVEDDLELLKATSTILKDNGLLYLSTQAGRRYKMDRHIFGHLRHYTKSELRSQLDRSGFKPLRISASGFPILTLQKFVVELLFQKVLKTIGSGGTPGRGLAFAMTMSYLAMRFFSLPIGPQLFAVAVRDESVTASHPAQLDI